jgi:putative flippase GtrA
MLVGLMVRQQQVQRRRAWFIVVGCGAAAVHWSVVVALVGRAGWHPLVANVLGWLVAFGVSFAGHHRLTFRGHGAPAHAAGLRFFVLSAGGFAINEAAYALLLHTAGLRYDVVLAVVLGAVALLTYWLSSHWAFLGRSQR